MVLPERLYLDSNILMPLVIEGHPSSQGMARSLRKLRRSAASLSLIVADVFLNEVISHLNIALEEFKSLDLEKKESREQYVNYFGLTGTNAFIAAYFNRPKTELDFSFEKWLRHHAPFATESDLAQWLTKREFLLVRTNPTSGDESRELGGIEVALDSAYDRIESRLGIGRKKLEVLKNHEARVLKRLRDDLKLGIRGYFVTDDKKLRGAVQLMGLRELEENVISNLGLVQLVNLTVGNKCDPHLLNTAAWSMRMVDEKMFLRSYLVDRIQKNYDAAMLLSMPKLLDATVERAAKEAALEKVNIRPSRDMNKGRTTRFIRRIESEFYSEMAKEVKKIKEQLR